MGAGEEMELVNPVTAGTELVLETTLEAVTPKQTRSGPCVFVTTLNTFTSADGAVLNRNRRTVVLRNPAAGVVMSITFQVGDVLPPLKHTATPFQLFRYSAVTWNPHRIHFDEPYAREEGHDGVALHSHLRAALALRCVTEGLGPGWQRHEGRLPAAQAGLRARRPGLHRPRDRGRGRQP